MTQADSVLSTPPTNTSLSHPALAALGDLCGHCDRIFDTTVAMSRRNLIGAAAVGIAGLSPVIATPACAAEPDPIFAAIERHRELSAAFDVAVKNADTLGEHPEQEALDAIVDDTSDALLDHADALIITEPTTVAGIVAIMRYFATLEDWQEPRDSEEWETSDGATVNWHQAFLDTLANALQGGRS